MSLVQKKDALTKGTPCFSSPEWESSHSVEYARIFNFLFNGRYATQHILPVHSRFIPWIWDAAVLSSICERAPIYFCGDPNYARAHGTNFRENGDGYFRGEGYGEYIETAWYGVLWILQRCMMQLGNEIISFFVYTERLRYQHGIERKLERISFS